MAVLTAAMNAFLSNVPACWASIVSALAALACPARSSVGASAASCASLAFDAAGGCARLSSGEALDVPRDLGERRDPPRAAPPVGATGGCKQLVGGQWRRARRAAPRPAGIRRRRRPAARPGHRRRLGAFAPRPCRAG